LRLSGQAANDAVVGVLDGSSAGYAADSLHLSGQVVAERVAGIEAFDSGAYVLDSLRLSGQAQNDVLADIADGGVPGVEAVESLEATSEVVTEGTAGVVEDSVHRDVVEDIVAFPQLQTMIRLILRPFGW
jgi:hypothetical protein